MVEMSARGRRRARSSSDDGRIVVHAPWPVDFDGNEALDKSKQKPSQTGPNPCMLRSALSVLRSSLSSLFALSSLVAALAEPSRNPKPTKNDDDDDPAARRLSCRSNQMMMGGGCKLFCLFTGGGRPPSVFESSGSRSIEAAGLALGSTDRSLDPKRGQTHTEQKVVWRPLELTESTILYVPPRAYRSTPPHTPHHRMHRRQRPWRANSRSTRPKTSSLRAARASCKCLFSGPARGGGVGLDMMIIT